MTTRGIRRRIAVIGAKDKGGAGLSTTETALATVLRATGEGHFRVQIVDADKANGSLTQRLGERDDSGKLLAEQDPYKGIIKADLFDRDGALVPHLIRRASQQEEVRHLRLPVFPVHADPHAPGDDLSLKIEKDANGTIVDVRSTGKAGGRRDVAFYLLDASRVKVPMRGLQLQWSGAGFMGDLRVEAWAVRRLLLEREARHVGRHAVGVARVGVVEAGAQLEAAGAVRHAVAIAGRIAVGATDLLVVERDTIPLDDALEGFELAGIVTKEFQWVLLRRPKVFHDRVLVAFAPLGGMEVGEHRRLQGAEGILLAVDDRNAEILVEHRARIVAAQMRGLEAPSPSRLVEL